MLSVQRIAQKTAGRRLRQASLQVGSWKRGLATAAEPYDVVVIGGGECGVKFSE
ncbi:hypothetical protein H0H87_003976 [Tephrocybe sp. NHM501043]|nr:hypothetical protein H0H87_003976 [Tephrocybe sp. NHM501043]